MSNPRNSADHFMYVPLAPMIDPGLSLKAKGWYAQVWSMQNRSGTKAPASSMSAIIRAASDGISSNNAAIKELTEAGYLTVEQVRTGRLAAFRFTLYETRQEGRA